jgi:hypothetical protein
LDAWYTQHGHDVWSVSGAWWFANTMDLTLSMMACIPWFPPQSRAYPASCYVVHTELTSATPILNSASPALCPPNPHPPAGGLPGAEGGHQHAEPHHPQPPVWPPRLRPGLLRPHCTQQVRTPRW